VLLSIRESTADVWLVYTFPTVTEKNYRDIIEHARGAFEGVRRFPGTLGGGEVGVAVLGSKSK
jgi:hypothetical protein